MRWLMKPSVTTLLILLCACSPVDEKQEQVTEEGPISLGERFVEDGDFRRSLLVNSFVNPSNGYSQLRAQNYGPGNAWDELEVWNPEVRFLKDDGSDAPFKPFPEIDFSTIDEEELRAIGKAAFERFPLAIDLGIQSYTQNPESIGLWKSESRIGGLVEVSLPTGVSVSKTCATCHANTRDGKLTYGIANGNLEYGRVLGTDWGHGTIDVTPDGQDNPTSIPDIRPIRFQEYLHWAATLNNSLGALAVRIETLFITSLSRKLRPPRGVAFALAYYFWTLSDEEVSTTNMESTPGYKHFEKHCITCHRLDGSTGAPIAIETIGTRPRVGESSRGTGTYRIPSLVGVSERGRFLHDASIDSLEMLFDSKRLNETPGHVFGLSLSENEKTELLDFLELF